MVFFFQIKLTHSLSIKEYWEQTSMSWWWVMAEASLPRRESGTLSRILQRASCLTPPTLRPTLRFSLRLFRIRKLLSEEISQWFLSRGESPMSSLCHSMTSTCNTDCCYHKDQDICNTSEIFSLSMNRWYKTRPSDGISQIKTQRQEIDMLCMTLNFWIQCQILV